jgi:hypothetical protein
MFSNFYHSTIRNTVVAFGTLFNDIYVVRENTGGTDVESIRVPLSYSSKEKFYYRMARDLEYQDQPHLQMSLPRMGFEISGYSYDNTRKEPTLQRRMVQDASNANKVKYHYGAVPYNIDFELYIMVRHVDDGLQIMEQILPYFTPHFTITMKPKVLKDSLEKIDVPIILTGVQTEENYEGGFDEGRVIVHTLSFSSKVKIYGPVRSSGIIQVSDINIFDIDQDENDDFFANIVARPVIWERDTDGNIIKDTAGNPVEEVDYTTIQRDDDWEVLININEWPTSIDEATG